MEYRLDLATLLQMLGKSSGILSSSSIRFPRNRGRYTVRLELAQGIVRKSTLLDERGRERAFPAKEIIELVKDLVFIWIFSPAPVHQPEPYPLLQLAPPSFIPPLSVWVRRVRQVSQQEFSSWPQPYRQVYSLINNPISLERVQVLLAHSAQDKAKIERIVTTFLQRGYIAHTAMPPR